MDRLTQGTRQLMFQLQILQSLLHTSVRDAGRVLTMATAARSKDMRVVGFDGRKEGDLRRR